MNVVVSPYDTEYVKVESGLSGGEMVKAQSAASASGSQRRMGGMPGGMPGGGSSRSSGSSSRSGGMPSGGGFGGPPGF